MTSAGIAAFSRALNRKDLMTNSPRIILGIDPGSRCTGYGIIGISGQDIKHIGHGQIRTKGDDLGSRLQQIHHQLNLVIDEFQPDEAAIEQIFTCRNPRSALILGHARGVALLAVSHLPNSEYSPRTIKQAVVGYGNAEKSQMQHMMRALLGLTTQPPSDAADALAVAWCHASSRRIHPSLLARS